MSTLGIYKSGQGYWVRVMTATLIAITTMASAAWLWSQMGVLATKLPVSSYAMSLQNVKGVPPVGQSVELFGAALSRGQDAPKLGTATLQTFNSSASEIRINNVSIATPLSDATLAVEVRSPAGGPSIGGAGSPAFSATIPKGTRGVPPIEPQLLQGLAAGLVLLIGSILAYYFCAVRAGTCEFLIATDMEMKKVNWSTRKDIRSSTLVVIAAAFLLAGSLFLIDVSFQAFFRLIGVLAK